MADALPLPKGAVLIEGDGQLPLPKGAIPITGKISPPPKVPDSAGPNLAAWGERMRGAELEPSEETNPMVSAADEQKAFEQRAALPAERRNKADPEYVRLTKIISRGIDSRSQENADAGIFAGIGGPAARGAVRAAGKVGPEVAGAIRRMIPGATKEAQALVSGVGEASDASILGSKMHRDLTSKINALVKERRATASKLKADYFAQGIAKEKEVADAYRNDLSAFLKAKARDLSPEQKQLIQDSFDHLGKDPSIEAIETERRRLADIASGSTEGYDGIQKPFAGSLSSNLRTRLTRAVPAAEKFFATYAEQSAPINMFEDTALGKRVVKGASDYLPDQPYYDPATLPSAFFKTKQSVQTLKTLAGGDKKFVSDAAGEYAASSLKDKGATEARAWLNKNKIWLDEVPDVQAEAERYVKNLEKVSHTQEKALAALKTGAVGGGIGAGLATGYHSLRSLLGW